MKWPAAPVLAAFLFLLAACTNLAASSPPQLRGAAPAAVRQEPVYQFDAMSQEGVSAVESGEAARYSYQLLRLSVPNLEALSPADAEAAKRNMENFNSRMDDLMEDALSAGRAMSQAAQEIGEAGELIEPYYDETTASFFLAGQLVSIRLDNSSYTGGAHPNSYTASQLFDLGTGQFIDPTQIAEDPESFRAGAAEALLEQAEALDIRDAFWTDYADIIARWNESAVLFDGEGMLVIFSHYELGPYAMGTVELRLEPGVLAELIGPAGAARLGLAAQ